jgi:hypothetical protein
MKKKVLKTTNILLTGAIAALGFGACKSSKNVVKETKPAPAPEMIKEGDIRVVYGPPPAYLQKEMPDTVKTKEAKGKKK